MKRISKKEPPTPFKKTKREVRDSSQSSFILPPKPTIDTKETKKDFISNLIKPKAIPEPIVLSSDDEEEITLQKNLLAESLDLSPKNTTTLEKSIESLKKINEKPVAIPNTVASAMDISNLDDDDDADDEFLEDQDDALDNTNENSPNNVTTILNDDMSEIDELCSDTELEELNEAPIIANETIQHINDNNLTTKINSEIIQINDEHLKLSDENMDIVIDNDTQDDDNLDTADIANNNTVNMDVGPSIITANRPVRETANKVKTYNDVANSIDPINLNYIGSSDSDESKPPAVIVARKPTKPRNSPAKIIRPVAILTKFIKELTSRRNLKTGFVYDTAMSYHATPNPMEIHPEDPRRIFKIFNILERHGLLQECKRINSRRATKEEIVLVHNILHYRKLRETSDLQCRSDYMAMENDYDSIYLNSNSFESALYAAGSLINLMEAVILDKVKNAFAIIRPPGHHAETDMPMGFCLFNNVAIATKNCMQKLNVKKVLIVDWDIHFGNGTQVIFSEDPNVLYVSLHRFEDALFYPSDKKGSASYTGYGKGVGKTVNIPWPCPGMTDADYLYAFHQVIMPIAMEFNPDVVVVSAGFDAAINDPIGKCNVTPAGYGQMTHMLKSVANGKLVVALEGGYDLNSIAVSALACMNVLLGDSPEPIDPNLIPTKECIETIIEVKKVQKSYWKCLS